MSRNCSENNQNVREDTDEEGDDVDDIVIEKEGEQPKDTINRLRDKLKECTAKKQEYLTGWQRAKADLANAKKEFDREREKVKRRGKEELVSSLLSALDSFEMAMADKETWEAVDETWRKGIEQIYEQITNALQTNDIHRIEPERGDQFDPQLHSSVDSRPANGDNVDNTIAECETIGYRIDERIIRSADVVIYSNQDSHESNT
ncbi:MAG: nucleotide exchange factor GrpE [Parcubacteria group bacterium SW_6_46_9]|nr:MAG: nucleotide exchange factor GrpE [Parcubacteria group bacterium SW_6_46_9]